VRRTHGGGKLVENFSKKSKEQDFLEDLRVCERILSKEI